jgi:hypothetical protein
MRSYANSRPRLFVESLEPRDVPTGVIQASLVNGTLTLKGDDLANIVSIQINTGVAPTVVLTPDTGTSPTLIDDVNDPATPLPGDPVTIPGPMTALKVDLGGGDDSLTIDGSNDFVLPGGASLTLGDGNNTLGLSTSGKIDLAKLSVQGGDGADTVTVAGGANRGSRVTGPAAFDLGPGDSTTSLTRVDFPGTAGVRLSAGPGSVTGSLTTLNVTVAKALRAAVGTGHLDLTLTGSQLGSLAVTGNTLAATLENTNVDGAVSVRGAFSSALTAQGAVTIGRDVTVGGGPLASFLSLATSLTARNVTVAGSVQSQLGSASGSFAARDISLTGSFSAYISTASGPFTARKVTISGSADNQLNTGSTAFSAGDVSVTGGQGAQVSEFGGTFTVHSLTAKATALAVLGLQGTTVTIGGDLKLSGGQSVQANVAASTLCEVKGNMSVAGGLQGTMFGTNGNLKVGRDLSLTTGDGADQVTIGDGSAKASVLGRLTIATGAGNDVVALNGLEVTKAVRVLTGAGSDALNIDMGTIFDGTFFADLGSGDDLIAVAQNPAAPVTFVGAATILAGAGNDTLRLGIDQGSGGNGNTQAVFTADVTNKIDGGTGMNTFDGLTPTQAPAQYTGLTATSFLHWTDPNP